MFEWKEAVEAAVAPPEAGRVRSQEEIEMFLAQKLGASLAVAPDAVDFSAPFSSFGLDSLRVMTLHGELEAWLGRPLLPTLFFNYPTVEALAAHLAEESAAGLDVDPLRG